MHTSSGRGLGASGIASILLYAGSLGLAAALHAQNPPPPRPFLNPLFSDHMVLQRDVETTVWGWTQPGAAVNVTLAGQTAAAVADAQGKWLTRLGALPAGGPHSLTVSGPQTETVEDVLIGDVWVCSGQSNMQMTVAASMNAREEIAAAEHPQIRQFSVPWCGFNPGHTGVMHTEPQDVVISRWEVCSPETAGNFTAVGYYFARELRKSVDVPVGLIRAAVGGSSIVSWCSLPVIQAVPELKGQLDSLDTLRALIKEGKTGEAYFAGVVKEWWNENDPGTREGWFQPDFDGGAWRRFTVAEGQKAADLPRYNGVVWFRKEVEIPPDWAGREVKLCLTGIYEPDTEWFNGAEVAAFGQGWINRWTTIPGDLVKAGRAVIAVRVLAQPGTGYQGPSAASRIELTGSKPLRTIPLDGDRSLRESTPRAGLPPFPHRLDNDFQLPTVLYNGMLAPLAPFAIRGALWYQGETPCPGGSPVHRRLLPAMIADWRARFASPEAWFLIVQLPVLGGRPTEDPGHTGCAEIRAVQWEVGKTVEHADTAVITDLGDPNDIHPKNKQDVGRRLALIAQARIFGREVEYSGPVFRAATVEGDTVRIAFDHVGGGLVVRGERCEGFAIAGDDQKWVWAEARLDGDGVRLSSPQVPAPRFVRYDYVDVPRFCLYNKAGLPAAPFNVRIEP
ncbi:MAG: Glycosyl hydrolases family 2, sugar binding domain [Lentisphaerae bacterium ADurb.BinA184]|nr:MAG: Glycosyl hydrolases family 2, sugar binding domain [Lentisphaerae bacterium ADurb.BinA184]